MTVPELNAALRRVPVWSVYLAGLLPLAWLVGRTGAGDLGADPVKEIELSLGLTGLQLIVVGLCVTPLRQATGVSLLRFRRAFGLLSFGYVALHLAVWVLLDLQLRWAEIGSSIARQPYILIGFAAFLLMLPLAATSNDFALRRMGPAAWRMLHRLTYVVAVGGAIHFVWLAKTWQTEPLTYLAAILALLGVRAVGGRRRERA